MVKYQQFDISIRRNGHLYEADVTSSQAGEATSRFEEPLSNGEREEFGQMLDDLTRSGRKATANEWLYAEEVGSRLFKAVFSDDVKTCYDTSLQSIRGDHQHQTVLRLCLRLTNAPDLIGLPWEYLYDPKARRFLALSQKTPVIRYLDFPESIPSSPLCLPLKMLVVVSDPADYEPANIWGEYSDLRQVLDGMKHLVMPDYLERATPDALLANLRKEQYHIIHYIGHAKFDMNSQEGALVLQNHLGQGAEFGLQLVGPLLHNHDSLRLVVLSACEGARASEKDAFSGVAQSLLRQGIPAVTAMQAKVSGNAAALFSCVFYNALFDGEATVESALWSGRLALNTSELGLEWGTPVLYTRRREGYLFQSPYLSDSPVASRQAENEASAGSSAQQGQNAFQKERQSDAVAIKALTVEIVLNGLLKTAEGEFSSIIVLVRAENEVPPHLSKNQRVASLIGWVRCDEANRLRQIYEAAMQISPSFAAAIQSRRS